MMPNSTLKLLINPFSKIAGWQALAIGLAAMAIGIVLSVLSEVHYNGLLHFGGGSNNFWWHFAIEHIIVWLIPSAIFYLGTIAISKTKVRLIDVLGTISFSQIPLVFMSLQGFIPKFSLMLSTPRSISRADEQIELVKQMLTPDVLPTMIMVGVISIVTSAWMLTWLYQALKVSSNLKGGKLTACFIIGIIISEAICRYSIALMK